MNALTEIEPMAREDEMRDIWKAIRTSQEHAELALSKQAVHEARCEGSQKLIEHRLRTVQNILVGVSGALGTGLATFMGWALPKLLGG